MIPVVGTDFSWLDVPEEELHLLDLAQAEREATESYLKRLITMTIEGARKGEDAHIVNLPLLISSLKEVEKPRCCHGFGSWNARVGKVLNIDRCRVIGEQVCQELGFSLDEAVELHNKYPHEDSFMELLANRYKPN